MCDRSRLIVKNLPSYLTESRLREHFAAKGLVTDVKVLYNQDGSSRRFGFVGYKTEEDARKALEYFDRTYVGTSKISVQVVQGTKDAPPPRPHKRPRLEGPDDEAAAALATTFKSKSQTDKKPAVEPPAKKNDKKGAQLDEFIKVMKPTKKGAMWSNGDDVPTPVAPAREETMDVEEDEAAPEEVPEGVSDLEWMQRRMKNTALDDEDHKAFQQSDDEDDAAKSKAKSKPAEEPKPADEEEQDTPSARLFVRNLAFSCTESDLKSHFSAHGTLVQVHIPLDTANKTSKGLAFVTYSTPDEASAAREALDGTSFQGRLLHILPAIERRKPAAPADPKTQTLKQQREAAKKANAGKEFNWAMLYMNADAVASSVAERMNVPKSDILNPDSADPTSAAVKLALAETHVITETKKYFEEHGVVLESFATGRTQRSSTIILVKNIPYGTTSAQLTELFAPHGALVRLLIPPAGTIAVVEFAHADEARSAFKGVAYKRLGSAVVYLEWAPQGMFRPDAPKGKEDKGGVVRVEEKEVPVVAPAEEGEVKAGTTLFVKNLAFSTNSDALRAVVARMQGFVFARVQMKPDPKRLGEMLSMGYGFVGFATADDAKRALEGLQGYILDGHELRVKFAGRGREDEAQDSRDGAIGGKKSAKMIVKNVPFEATRKDLRALFGAHGHLKSVRLPKKFNSRSRGFAFLEFVSHQEAEHAFATLRHTHFLGRHLVLEWASSEGDAQEKVEELRRKVGRERGDGGELPGKKRKVAMIEDEDDGEADD
ncbi:RNA-binding domain-containing protein [Auricularia subglabra TFB-10046 SS5]|nr:RNA-binding domain-containing protein [Auricularia subglabra TFB-10046 SS5]